LGSREARAAELAVRGRANQLDHAVLTEGGGEFGCCVAAGKCLQRERRRLPCAQELGLRFAAIESSEYGRLQPNCHSKRGNKHRLLRAWCCSAVVCVTLDTQKLFSR